MDRYIAIQDVVARPSTGDPDDWAEPHRTMVIHEEDAAPVRTGLLDAHGVALYRVADRVPVGYRASRRSRP
jgi:hypothetical protein